MIAPDLRASGSVAAEDRLRHFDGLAGVVHINLDSVAAAPRTQLHLSPERRRESVLGSSARFREAGVDHDRLARFALREATLSLASSAARSRRSPATSS